MPTYLQSNEIFLDRLLIMFKIKFMCLIQTAIGKKLVLNVAVKSL